MPVAFGLYAGSYYVALLQDSGNSWSPLLWVGQTGTTSNSQCTLDGGATGVHAANGTTLHLDIALTFTNGFVGPKNIWTYVADFESNASGWIYNGTWMVGNDTAPGVISTAPASGTGSRRVFTLTLNDTPSGRAGFFPRQ